MPAGRALWLLPEEGVRRRLSLLTESLARERGTPTFEPHVTLAARIGLEPAEASRRAGGLARETPPLDVVLTAVATTDAYYRAVILDVSGAALSTLHVRAAGLMEARRDLAFRPHVSLLYGLLTAEAKQAIADAVGRHWNLPCRLDRLALVLVEGDPADWTVERTFALEGS